MISTVAAWRRSGSLFAILTGAIFTALAWFSGMDGVWVRKRPSMSRVIDRLTGIVFFGLGPRLAFTNRG